MESAYAECLAIELHEAGLPFQREVPLRMRYRGRDVPVHYKLDLVVAGSVVVEVKSVERLMPLHRAQLLTYLRLGNYSRGLLVNFGMVRLQQGIQRVVNGWVAPPGLVEPQRGGPGFLDGPRSGNEPQRGIAGGAEGRGG